MYFYFSKVYLANLIWLKGSSRGYIKNFKQYKKVMENKFLFERLVKIWNKNETRQYKPKQNVIFRQNLNNQFSKS